MEGLKLLEKVFRLEEVERVPWVPFVGVHGGKLIDVDAEAYLKSSKNLVDGLTKAIELYRPDGIPVAFDLQIEAEILGCKLAWSKENPPAVISHPLAEGTDLKSLKLPSETDGRISVVLEATKELRKKNPELALYGLITGPFTLALHLLGTDIFMKLFEDPEYVHELMQFCAEVGIKHAEMLLDAGCDVIAVVDPMTSQIDPGSFEAFVSPYCKMIFDFVRLRKKYSSFFVCGHAQQNIEVMCDCKPDNVSIDENIPLDYVKDVCLKKGISFGGNMKLTSVLLLGNEMDSKKDAVSCLDLGDKKGFILAPGCDLPMDTPVENMKAVTELVYDEYVQQATREMEHTSSLQPLDLDGHFEEGKVVVDIITLDSASCAPCQYMVEAVNQASIKFGEKVQVIEHKIKDVDGIRMMMALGVQNVPTTCINGNVKFISQIPPKSEIEEAIQKRIDLMGIRINMVTGFLGSGKTSFVNHYLKSFGTEKKIAIIQNEFSPVNIDGRELHHSGNYEILEINNGSVFCVCLLGSFIHSLSKFVDEVEPDEIIMEASGMSDPLGVGQMFQSDNLRGKVYLGHVWAIIDASNYFRAEALRNRINHQLRVADTIIINKIDLAKDTSEKVIDDVKKINPFAHVVKSTYSKADLSVMKKSFGVFPNEESAEDCRPAIESFVIKSSLKISLSKLSEFFTILSPKIIRSKGFVKISNGKTVFLQVVYDNFSYSETKDYSEPTEFVIIGNFTPNENLQIRFDEFCKS